MVAACEVEATGADHLLPQALEDNQELAHVIRIVVCDQQDFAEVSLALPVRNRREQIDLRVRGEFLHGLQVAAKSGDGAVPRRRVFGLGFCGPVAIRKLGGHVIGITTELQYVPLRDPHVFEKLPRRVRDAPQARPGNLGWIGTDGVFDRAVGLSTLEKFYQLFA